jgi:hypothetical protein
MRRGRILIFLVLIVVIGLALLYFAWTQFGGLTAVAPTPAALTEVYFAAQNIPQGTEITREMLGTFSIPPENVAEVMFTVGEEGALIGQTARFPWIRRGHYLFHGWYWTGRNFWSCLGSSNSLWHGRGSHSDKPTCFGWIWCS